MFENEDTIKKNPPLWNHKIKKQSLLILVHLWLWGICSRWPKQKKKTKKTKKPNKTGKT